MGYAALVAGLSSPPVATTANGKEFLTAPALIAGPREIGITIRCFATGSAAKALQEKKAGDRIIASGEIQLDPEGSHPIIDATVLGPAHDDQYLNEVVIVGRIGGDARSTEKSAKRSIAVNRYRRDPDTNEVVEETDWYGVRGFGNLKTKLEGLGNGALVEVSGVFEQLENKDGQAYCEIKARAVKVHRNRKGGSSPAAGKATGYDADDFQGTAEDIATDWN